jgi:hypothetical protein
MYFERQVNEPGNTYYRFRRREKPSYDVEPQRRCAFKRDHLTPGSGVPEEGPGGTVLVSVMVDDPVLGCCRGDGEIRDRWSQLRIAAVWGGQALRRSR